MLFLYSAALPLLPTTLSTDVCADGCGVLRWPRQARQTETGCTRGRGPVCSNVSRGDKNRRRLWYLHFPDEDVRHEWGVAFAQYGLFTSDSTRFIFPVCWFFHPRHKIQWSKKTSDPLTASPLIVLQHSAAATAYPSPHLPCNPSSSLHSSSSSLFRPPSPHPNSLSWPVAMEADWEDGSASPARCRSISAGRKHSQHRLKIKTRDPKTQPPRPPRNTISSWTGERSLIYLFNFEVMTLEANPKFSPWRSFRLLIRATVVTLHCHTLGGSGDFFFSPPTLSHPLTPPLFSRSFPCTNLHFHTTYIQTALTAQ